MANRTVELIYSATSMLDANPLTAKGGFSVLAIIHIAICSDFLVHPTLVWIRNNKIMSLHEIFHDLEFSLYQTHPYHHWQFWILLTQHGLR